MKELRPALLLFLLLSLLCGGLYPAVVTVLAQLLFPVQANGSLLTDAGGKVLGSALIGQPFSEPQYLWPRPSATAEFAANPLASGGTNGSPASAAYGRTIDERVRQLRSGGVQGSIAADLVQASGSGLDPHISPLAAGVQVPRIAKARHISEEQVAAVIAAHLEERQCGFLGAPRINVLAVNRDLDKLVPQQ